MGCGSLDTDIVSIERSRSVWLRAGLLVVGIMLMTALWWPPRAKILRGWNDFVSFYAGSRLAGSRDLYNPERMMEVQRETAGITGQALQFIRPPYYAVMLWPIGRLPFRLSYVVWQSLSFAAVVGFVALWPAGSRWAAILACSWSVPLSWCFAQGQDCAFLLIWIALALRLHDRHPFVAGLLLSLCAPKFHLFLSLPVLIALQQRWRLAYGFIAGAGAMLAISFVAGGATWPLEYYNVLRSATISPGANSMPNLHGLLAGAPYATAIEIVLDAFVAIAVGIAVRRASFHKALSATLIGGLLVSNHAYLADAIVLIPALLLILRETETGWLKLIGFTLLTPLFYVGVLIGGTPGRLLPLALMLILGVLAARPSSCDKLLHSAPMG